MTSKCLSNTLDAFRPQWTRRLRSVPASLVNGGFLLGTITVFAVLADWIAPFPIDEMHIRDRLMAPNLTYLFGTDDLGRDVLSRTLDGAGLSLGIGCGATLLSSASWRTDRSLRGVLRRPL